MSLKLFEEYVRRSTSGDLVQGFIDGFVLGSATAKNVSFPDHLPASYRNSSYVYFVYGQNQEDVSQRFVPICSNEDHDYCKIEVFHLLEKIQSFVDDDGREDRPEIGSPREAALKFLLKRKLINKVKKELIIFAIITMQRRIQAVKDLNEGKPCTVCELIKDDAKSVNNILNGMYREYNFPPLVLIDEESLSLRYA